MWKKNSFFYILYLSFPCFRKMSADNIWINTDSNDKSRIWGCLPVQLWSNQLMVSCVSLSFFFTVGILMEPCDTKCPHIHGTGWQTGIPVKRLVKLIFFQVRINPSEQSLRMIFSKIDYGFLRDLSLPQLGKFLNFWELKIIETLFHAGCRTELNS